MTKLEYCKAVLGDAEGQRKLIEWLSNDMTQLLLSVTKELAVARPMIGYSAIEKVQALGESVGANRVIDFLADPVGSGAISDQGSQPSMIPDYGAEDILKEKGYE